MRDYVKGDTIYVPVVGYLSGGTPTSINSFEAGLFKDNDLQTPMAGVSDTYPPTSSWLPDGTVVLVTIDTTLYSSDIAYYSAFCLTGTITDGEDTFDIKGTPIIDFWLNRVASTDDLTDNMFDRATAYRYADSVSGSVVKETALGSSEDLQTGSAATYHAVVRVDFATGGLTSIDRYTVTWFRIDNPVQAGISSPKISVQNRQSGVNLVDNQTMDEVTVGSGWLKYDSSNLISTGQTALITVSAVIDNATRTWRHIIPNPD